MNGFTIIVSIVKVPVSPEGCRPFGNASLQESLAPGQSISRILSRIRVSPRGHLTPGRSSISAGCLQPVLAAYPALKRDGQPLARTRAGFAPAWPCSRWGLPGRRITTVAGGLLHRLFTLAGLFPADCFCGPYPAGCPAPGVTRHRALWSADFPHLTL
jgi:hypothetical protein